MGSGSLRLYFSRNAAAYAGGHGRSPHFPARGSPGRAKTIVKMRNVAPRITGIICSRRRMT
jgi:hypothetical protein